jgi:hypothetical protein
MNNRIAMEGVIALEGLLSTDTGGCRAGQKGTSGRDFLDETKVPTN